MQAGFAIGRIIVGAYYLFGGVSGLLNLSATSGFAAAKGVPAAELAVIVSHVLLIVAGLCILTGYKPVVAVVALVVFFLPVTFMMHGFWTEREPMARMSQMVHFTKNLALMGSALMFLGIPRPWRWSPGATEP